MTALTYKGYVATIAYDPDDEIFFGRISGLSDLVGFHAAAAFEIKAAFREAVDDYIDTCAEIGKAPEKPYSGKLMFRVDPKVHANAAMAAKAAGRSLNQWAEDALRLAAERDLGQPVAIG